jgi:rfaE bifunctional protein nucleotidyltransferase chain/domain
MDYRKILEQKIFNAHTLMQRIKVWRDMFNRKIVFTNGCFDILHRGHVDYLSAARSLGDILIVGVNTDASVKRLNKSPERPINNEKDRAYMVAALHVVDAVILFDEDTPYELIKMAQPDILVKGSDYKPENIVGADIVTARGGEVVTIELTEGFSTSSLIQKIKS